MKRTSESLEAGLFKALGDEAGQLLAAGKTEEFKKHSRTYFAWGSDIRKVVTFEDQVAKAGGRLVKVPSGKVTAADWHEQDPT